MSSLITDRKFGQDLDTLTWNATVPAANLFSFAGRCQTGELEKSAETMQNSALKDTSQAARAKPAGAKFSFTCAVEKHVDTIIQNPMNYVGYAAAFVLKTASAATSGSQYSGSAILIRCKHTFPDGGQTLEMEFVVNGDLTCAAAA